MRVNILLLNLFNVQARQVLMESRLPNSVLSKVILNLMSLLFTLHYIKSYDQIKFLADVPIVITM